MFAKNRLKSMLLMSGLVMAAALTGCDTLDQMEADNFRKECINLGIQPGSPNFERCMLQQQALEENSLQHSMDRVEMEETAKMLRKR
ncbi:hypothetical protein [Advenella mimigardefordensis]|uniref:hypothetical protein n=1 Tax=Advenella mimigardefordensis TaxID=302406 RepID=UPI00046D9304|nr:hypothetical protein [Advenella mimigardefordensis]